MSDEIGRTKCECGGILYREDDFVCCTGCDKRCIVKQKSDLTLPTYIDLEKQFK
jgi:hypothetical protein